MNLENRLPRKVVRRIPSEEISSQIREGKKFIVVGEHFDQSMIPSGYSLIDLTHDGKSFKTLVPQRLLFYIANPGEGEVDSALEEIADFYGEAEEFEDEMIEGGETSVQEANWATMARSNYQVYLINKLVKHKAGEKDARGEPVAEFNQETITSLGLNEEYISQRVRAMAGLALGKDASQLKKFGAGDVLKHVTIRTVGEKRTSKISREEFDKVACWAGSHYEIKPEFRNLKDVSYDLERRHDPDYKVGTKTAKDVEIEVIDTNIAKLEEEIRQYRLNRGPAGRHDDALIKMYANLAYIAKENPGRQFDITPPKKDDEVRK